MQGVRPRDLQGHFQVENQYVWEEQGFKGLGSPVNTEFVQKLLQLLYDVIDPHQC